MEILVTGATGFLGSVVINLLSNQNRVIAVASNSGKSVNIQGVKVYNIDNPEFVSEKPEVVVMCHAAVSSGTLNSGRDALFNANVKFTERITGLFPDAYHLYISSVSVYGSVEQLLNESSSLNPESEYAVSKLWGEKVTASIPGSGILRLASLYGTGMKGHTIIPTYVGQALKNGKIEIWGKGERLQNYLHVNDAAGYIESMVKNKLNGIFLASSKKETSNLQLAEMIASLTGAVTEYKGTDDSPSRRFNNEISRAKLNITNELDLAEGLKEYILWNKKQSL